MSEMPLLGWRVWRWDRNLHRLRSLSSMCWESAEVQANCHKIYPWSALPQHRFAEIPAPDCSCGIYATVTRDHADLPNGATKPSYIRLLEDSGLFYVKGAVALSGRLQVHRNGVVRAQYARVLCIAPDYKVRPEIFEEIESFYGVPVFADDSEQGMRAYLAEHSQEWRQFAKGAA